MLLAALEAQRPDDVTWLRAAAASGFADFAPGTQLYRQYMDDVTGTASGSAVVMEGVDCSQTECCATAPDGSRLPGYVPADVFAMLCRHLRVRLIALDEQLDTGRVRAGSRAGSSARMATLRSPEAVPAACVRLSCRSSTSSCGWSGSASWAACLCTTVFMQRERKEHAPPEAVSGI